RTDTAGGHSAPGKESQQRARMPGFVAVIQMVGRGVIEVDGLLDQAQAQALDVEVDVALRVPGNRRDVVQSAGACGHGGPPGDGEAWLGSAGVFPRSCATPP